jgi:hypothetical protein
MLKILNFGTTSREREYDPVYGNDDETYNGTINIVEDRCLNLRYSWK